MLKTKRIYDEYEENDGYRILVERLWPRGVSKERARLDQWLKGIAPSHELRKWYGHDQEKWDEFREKYRKELFGSPYVEELMEIISKNETVTLIYASKEETYNSTMVLKQFMEDLLGG